MFTSCYGIIWNRSYKIKWNLGYFLWNIKKNCLVLFCFLVFLGLILKFIYWGIVLFIGFFCYYKIGNCYLSNWVKLSFFFIWTGVYLHVPCGFFRTLDPPVSSVAPCLVPQVLVPFVQEWAGSWRSLCVLVLKECRVVLIKYFSYTMSLWKIKTLQSFTYTIYVMYMYVNFAYIDIFGKHILR